MPHKFRAATWNLFSPTDRKKSEPVLKDSLKWGTQLWFMNEAAGSHRADMLRDHGLKTVNNGQWRLAWDPERFKLVRKWNVRLSNQPYYATGKTTPKYNDAIAAILEDLEAEKELEVLSYHTAAGIQHPGMSMDNRRFRSVVESYRTMTNMADDSEADGWMAAGDDNWDEDGPNDDGGGIQYPIMTDLMLNNPIMRQVQAEEPTLGPREIDDFRIVRLRIGGQIRPTGEIRVRDGGGSETPAHKIHMREWEWRRRR